MTVARLRVEMPSDEYVRWRIYYQRKAQRAELEALKSQASGRR